MISPYPYTPAVTEQLQGVNGPPSKAINPDKLDMWKTAVDNQLNHVSTELSTMITHANWIEPRIHEFLAFMTWMEKAHPDIIDAFKKSTEVAEKLDKANGNYDEEVMMEGSA